MHNTIFCLVHTPSSVSVCDLCFLLHCMSHSFLGTCIQGFLFQYLPTQCASWMVFHRRSTILHWMSLWHILFQISSAIILGLPVLFVYSMTLFSVWVVAASGCQVFRSCMFWYAVACESVLSFTPDSSKAGSLFTCTVVVGVPL